MAGTTPAPRVCSPRFIREELPGRRVRLVYASMRDKAIREICAILFPLAEEVYLTHPEKPRAATPGRDSGRAGFPAGQVCTLKSSPFARWRRPAAPALRDDVVLVVGSLFLVGAIKKAQSEGNCA